MSSIELQYLLIIQLLYHSFQRFDISSYHVHFPAIVLFWLLFAIFNQLFAVWYQAFYICFKLCHYSCCIFNMGTVTVEIDAFFMSLKPVWQLQISTQLDEFKIQPNWDLETIVLRWKVNMKMSGKMYLGWLISIWKHFYALYWFNNPLQWISTYKYK